MKPDFLGNAKNNTTQLQRFQALEMFTSRLIGGWLPGIERWELKHDIGKHIWENTESCKEIRTRLWELRINKPDKGVSEQVHDAIKSMARAQHDYKLIAGIYLVLKPALLAAYEEYIEETPHLYDYPSVPVLEKIIETAKEQIKWGERTVNELTDSGEKKRNMTRWTRHVTDVLEAIGGVSGNAPTTEIPTPPPAYSMLLPFADAARDERFDIQLALPEMPEMTDKDWTEWHFMGYATEMQAAETLATCLWEVEGMEWEFYYDVARHCWDEIRHSQMGCHRLAQLGRHISDFPHSTGSFAWRQTYDPVIRYCALTYVIEADSFLLKQKTYQHYLASNDIESAQAVMYDIVDETLHVRWGTKWTPELMKKFGYTQTVDELVQECREIVIKNSCSGAQSSSSENAKMARGNGY